MAIYKIFPEKDTTLYSSSPIQNTGLDGIIETSTTFLPGSPQASRFLIKFSQEEIESVINNTISGSVTDATGSLVTGSKEFQANLRCYISNVNGLSKDSTLDIFPLAESWDMGTGKYNDLPVTINGGSWKYREAFEASPWTTSSFTVNTTASYPSDNPGGGVWYYGYIGGVSVGFSQSLSYYSSKDINTDVTNAVKLYYSNSISNEGFIVKQNPSSEFQSSENNVSSIQYFSIDTNTIYPPQLEFKWRDWVYANTSSYFIPSGSEGSGSYSTIDISTIIDTPQLVATLANNKGEYKRDSIHKFYINCRPQYPVRSFQTSSVYTTNYFLPTASYYAIKDLHTNEFVIDFDENYTQISADLEGSYFTLYMNGLEPERYYQVVIKTYIKGNVLVLDDNYYFKIING